MFSISLGILLFLGPALSASDTVRNDSAMADAEAGVDADLAKLESELRSSDYDVRQRAMLSLWNGRDRYRHWVEQAVHDTDPEVARRTSWVLDRWRRGILPDTPRDIAKRLEAASGPDTIESLLNAGLFAGAAVALDESIDAAEHGALVDRADSAIRRRFPFFVRLAHQNGELGELTKVLARLAYDPSMTLARERLQHMISSDVSDELPSAAVPPMARDRDKIAIITQAVNGDVSKAMETAQQSGRTEFLRVCRMLAGDWGNLAHEQATAAQAQPAGSLEAYRHWIFALLASSRADLNDAAIAAIRTQSIDQLAAPRGGDLDSNIDDPINRVRWQALAMHGEVNAAIKILSQLSREDASEVLAQCMRFVDAFAVLDINVGDLDSEIYRLRDAAIGSQGIEGLAFDEPTPELRRLLASVRLLVSTGREKLALETLETVVSALPDELTEQNEVAKITIIRAVSRMNRSQWIGQLLIRGNAQSISPRIQFYLALAFDFQQQTVGTIMDALTRMKPRSPFASRLLDTVGILSGTKPDSFDDGDYEAMFALISQSRNVVRDFGRGVVTKSVSRLSLDIANIFEQHDQVSLSQQVLRQLADDGDIEAKLILAEAELSDGRAGPARQSFQQVWNLIDTASQDLSRLNESGSDGLLAMRAIYGECLAAKRLGDTDGAAELEQLIQWMQCSPSASLQSSFGEFLIEQGQLDQAEIIFASLLPLAAFGVAEGVEYFGLARHYDSAVATTKPIAAANAFDLAIAGTIETTVFYPSAYISLPAYVHRRMAKAALLEKDEAGLARCIDRLLRLDPIDIDFGEKMFDDIRKAGMIDLVDQTLTQMHAAGTSHMATFPLDVSMANNLAWVMALSDYKLDDALQLSRRAVHYEPESTVYRDTLAEILFRLGRPAEAIAIEQACLLDDPGEWHVHEQIRRFTTPAG